MSETKSGMTAEDMLVQVFGSWSGAVLDAVRKDVVKLDLLVTALNSIRHEMVQDARDSLKMTTSFWPSFQGALAENAVVRWLGEDRLSGEAVEFIYDFRKAGYFFRGSNQELMSVCGRLSVSDAYAILPIYEVEIVGKLQDIYDKTSVKDGRKRAS